MRPEVDVFSKEWIIYDISEDAHAITITTWDEYFVGTVTCPQGFSSEWVLNLAKHVVNGHNKEIEQRG